MELIRATFVVVEAHVSEGKPGLKQVNIWSVVNDYFEYVGQNLTD